MRGPLLRAAALAVLVFPPSLAAQRPFVSPVLPRVWNRAPDTTLSVWLFVRPAASLPAFADRAAALGARVRVRSRWLHAISVDAPAAALRTLARDPDLRRMQPLGRFRLDPKRAVRDGMPAPAPLTPAANDSCGPEGDPVYGPSEMPLRRLNLRPLIDRGFDGTGVTIGLLDTGFDTQNPAFAGVTVLAQRDFVFNDSVVRNEPGIDAPSAHSHGTSVWSLLAANNTGRVVGIARGATYLLAKTEDVRSETRVEEDNYVAALEWADSIGVDIVSSSLAYLVFDNGFFYSPSEVNGDSAVTTMAADSAVRRGIVVVTAAGNTGPQPRTIWTPADGDSVLAIGAEDSLGAIVGFSARGPTADGRIKPDFTAPGLAVCVVTGPGTVGRSAGTSFATPLVAAGITLLLQEDPALTPMAVRDALRNSATNRADPDTIFGWGRPDVGAAAGLPSGDVTAIAPVTSPLTSITPVFSWTLTVPMPPPVTYRLRIASDSLFGTLVLDTTLSTETVDLRRPLKPGRIFWRVDARNDAADTASTGRIGPLTVPLWATPTSLSNPAGAVTDSVQPTFTWRSPDVSSPPGPYSYDLFVRRAADSFPVFGVNGVTDTSFRLPQPLERNAMYRWLLVTHVGSDTSLSAALGSFLVIDGGTPTATLLYQNFPNPFPTPGRDATCLWFDLAFTGMVELEILDLRGNPVRRFIPGPDFPAILPAGRYGRGQAGGTTCDPRLMWDGHADDGHPLPAGVYLSKLKAPGLVVFKRIVYRGK